MKEYNLLNTIFDMIVTTYHDKPLYLAGQGFGRGPSPIIGQWEMWFHPYLSKGRIERCEVNLMMSGDYHVVYCTRKFVTSGGSLYQDSTV